jgi:hypothetical protein
VGKTPLEISKVQSGPVVLLLRGYHPRGLPELASITTSGEIVVLKPLPIANWIRDALTNSGAGLPSISDRELHVLTRVCEELGLLNTAPEKVKAYHNTQLKERQKWIQALREGNTATFKELAKNGFATIHWNPAVREVFASITGERSDAIWAFGHFKGGHQESIVEELCRQGNLVAAKHCTAAIRQDDRAYSEAMSHYTVAFVRERGVLSDELNKWIDDPTSKGADSMSLGRVVEALAEVGDINAALRLTDHAKFRSDTFQTSRKFAVHDIVKAMIDQGKVEDALKLIRQLPAKERNGAVERNGFATVRALAVAGSLKDAVALLAECDIRPEERCLMLCSLAEHAASEVEARKFLADAESLIPSIVPKVFLDLRGGWSWPEIARVTALRSPDDVQPLRQRFGKWLTASNSTLLRYYSGFPAAAAAFRV